MMSTITKPMLSGTAHQKDLEKLSWPMLCSPKIDGLRCLTHPELGAVTRSFKPIPNTHVREQLLQAPKHLDGELIGYSDIACRLMTFNETQSALMSHSGQPNFRYYVFDDFTFPDDPFEDRINGIDTLIRGSDVRIIKWPHEWIHSAEEFIAYAAKCAEDGYEGAMLRLPLGPYKSGRSTLNQQWLLKYKEWADAEGTIIGFEEKMHNANEDVKDEFGYAKRSSHKAGMVATGTLGALILETEWGTLNVGSGFDDSLRQEIWNRNMVEEHPVYSAIDGAQIFTIRGIQPDKGRVVTFKYQAFGMQDKPRFPIFKGFRED